MNEVRWRVQHRTTYLYAAAARDSFNDIRLRPPTNERQSVESFDLMVKPEVPVNFYRDFYSNWVHHFEVVAPHTELTIESRCVVHIHPPPMLSPEAVTAPLTAMPELVKTVECFDYLGSSRFVEIEPDVWRMAIDATVGISDTWQAAQAIMRFVHGHLAYAPESTSVHTLVRDVLNQRKGVCQDFAHVMVGLCRAIRIPARYVSGYLAVEQARATHAWVEIWIPRRGWLAVDPTHNRQIDDSYIKIAVGRDYSDVPPVTGTYRGSVERKMEIDVQIDPVKPSLSPSASLPKTA